MRFRDSNLDVDYIPAGSFDTGGSFNTGTNYKLDRFVTTATTLNDPGNALNFAFAGSQIAVDTIGIIRLSGLGADNGGAAFGIKFRSVGGNVQVKTTDGVGIPLNTKLTPAAAALADDFFYLDV